MSSLTNGLLPQGLAGLAADPAAPAPDPEVAAVAKRRQYPNTEKRRILSAADRCKKPGEMGALLRKEGIYSSMLASWRKQRARGEMGTVAAPKRGPKANPVLAQVRREAQLERELDRLRRRLAQAQEIIKVQKKLCNLLGLPTTEIPEEID